MVTPTKEDILEILYGGRDSARELLLAAERQDDNEAAKNALGLVRRFNKLITSAGGAPDA